MEDNIVILKTLSETFSELSKAILRFDENNFNTKPFEGNWSPAMVAQHLVLAGTGFDQVILGRTKPTVGAADTNIAQLRAIFLNFELKMTSPAFIEPADESYDQQELIKQLNQIGDAVMLAASKSDLTATCLDFEFPGIGHLTRLEAIHFLIYHTQRHTHQLNTMAN